MAKKGPAEPGQSYVHSFRSEYISLTAIAARSPPAPTEATWLLTHGRVCPVCRSTRFRPSHRRNTLERAISLLVLPFRCKDWGSRFFLIFTGHRPISVARIVELGPDAKPAAKRRPG